jgi:phospholipid-binding lipoprotein MlaA
MSKTPLKFLQTVSLLFLLCAAAGCSSSGEQDLAVQPAQHQFSDFYEEGVDYPVDVYDPLEGFNRGVYKFNAVFDKYVFLPVVNAYETVTPEFARTGVSNFFTNIGEIITFANEVLQLKFEAAGMTVFRFVANSTVGFLGFFDVTSYEGIPRTDEDFGQTLGYWGAGEGPFLVLPILGPSNVRDTAGFATDTVAFALVDPLTLSSMQTDYPAILALNIINKRYTQPFRYYETGSPFEYELLRFLYTEKRRADIEK